MRPPYTLVLEYIDLLKSYGSAEMTAMVDAGSQFAKPSIAVRWRFFEYSISTLGPQDSFGCPTGDAWLCPKGLAIRY